MLVVARSAATYAAFAGLAIWIAHRCVAPIRRRVALLLAAAPLLFTGSALLTGRVYAPVDVLYNAQPFGTRRAELGIAPDRTPLLADIAYQALPWAAAVRRDLDAGRAPLWNPYTLAGEPLLAVQQPAALHPITLASLALPFPQGVTLAATLRILAALLFAYLYLREIGCGEPASLLGGIGWALCDWMTFYLEYPEQPTAAALPLLLLGLRRIAREPGARPAAISAVAFFLAAASGHPETLLHVAVLAAAYFAFEVAAAPPGVRARAWRTAFLAGAAGAGLAAAVLLPFLEAIPHTYEHALRQGWYARQPRSLPWTASLERLKIQLVPVLAGRSGHGEVFEGLGEPPAYAGAIILPLALTGLLARRRERWFFAAAGLLGLAVYAGTPAADLLARLPGFDVAINERLIFVGALALCVLAAFGADRLGRGEGTAAFLVASAATLGLVLLLASRNGARWTALRTPPEYVRECLRIEIVALVLGAALIAALPRLPRARLGAAALVVLLAGARSLEAAGTFPSVPAAALYPRFPILERIPRGEPYRIAGIGNALIPNASAAYGLEDVRGYSAMTLRTLRDTFPLWCVAQPIWFNRIDDATRPFLSFLNVRWLLTELAAAPPPGWREVAESDGLRLYENPAPLPRAFAPRRVRREPDPGRALEELSGVHDFGERGVVEDSPRSDWEANGAARVEIARLAPGQLEIDVDAPEGAVVGTSITAWPGWRAELGPDRRRLPLLVYNHAFLGVRLPPGRHRLRLRYAPRSFEIGAAVSLTTFAAGLVLLLRRRG